jgi:hypothetical protein
MGSAAALDAAIRPSRARSAPSSSSPPAKAFREALRVGTGHLRRGPFRGDPGPVRPRRRPRNCWSSEPPRDSSSSPTRASGLSRDHPVSIVTVRRRVGSSSCWRRPAADGPGAGAGQAFSGYSPSFQSPRHPPASTEEVLDAFRAPGTPGRRLFRQLPVEQLELSRPVPSHRPAGHPQTGLGFNRVLVGIRSSTPTGRTPPDLWRSDGTHQSCRLSSASPRPVVPVGGNVAWLAIGNGGPLSRPGQQWGPYATFFGQARQYARGAGRAPSGSRPSSTGPAAPGESGTGTQCPR